MDHLAMVTQELNTQEDPCGGDRDVEVPLGEEVIPRENALRARVYVITLVTFFILLNARWIWVYRSGLALDIDEAGYLNYSLIDYYGLKYGGISGWIAAMGISSIQAPLTMGLSSLIYALVGPHIIAAFSVPLAAGAASIAVTYELGRSVASRRVGLAAAFLVATCPITINYSRSYQFSMVATLFATLALLSIVRSQGFRNTKWTIIFGVCMGLMPLARTMTLAFFPGFIAAAFFALASHSGELKQRISRLGLGAILGILVSATWYWKNGPLVVGYLFNFGYGAHALEYGPKSSKLGLDAWYSMVIALNHEIYFIHFALLTIGILINGFCIALALRRIGACDFLSRTLSSQGCSVLNTVQACRV